MPYHDTLKTHTRRSSDRFFSLSPERSHLLFLGTTAARLLGSLDSLLIALGLALLHGTHQATGSLEGTLEVARGGLAVKVDLDQVALEQSLDRQDGLNQQRVGVLEVQVHKAHHGDTHKLTAEGSLELSEVVGLDGRSNELALLSRANGSRLNILEGGEVCERLLVQTDWFYVIIEIGLFVVGVVEGRESRNAYRSSS